VRLLVDGQVSRGAIGSPDEAKIILRVPTGYNWSDVEQTKDVDTGIELGIFGRDSYAMLCCLVAEQVLAHFIEDRLPKGVSSVISTW